MKKFSIAIGSDHAGFAYKEVIKAMLLALQKAGIATEVSQTAGTFVCNHVFYGLMHEMAQRRALGHTRGGFIHVPWLPEQAAPQGAPAMALPDIINGLRIAVRTALTTQADAQVGAGALN